MLEPHPPPQQPGGWAGAQAPLGGGAAGGRWAAFGRAGDRRACGRAIGGRLPKRKLRVVLECRCNIDANQNAECFVSDRDIGLRTTCYNLVTQRQQSNN